LDIDPSTTIYEGYHGVNAVVTKDGNILMLLGKGRLRIYSGGTTDYSLTLLKISPNTTTGENIYLWRRTLNNLKTELLNYKNEFIPFPFKMIDTLSEKYMLAFGRDGYFNFGSYDKEANSINYVNNYSFFNIESSLDFEIFDNSIYFLAPNYFSKLSLNGILEWKKKLIGIDIKTGFGIYVKPDKSITTFCNYLNAQNELDIGALILNENGEIITKQ
jgi:hypothetical protein